MGLKLIGLSKSQNKTIAKKYIKSPKYLWNSGMVACKQSIFLSEMERYCPEIHKICKRMVQNLSKDLSFERISETDIAECPNISIDYALMEKTNKLVVVPLEVKWSDLGTWSSVDEISLKDNDRNFVKGNVVSKLTKNSFIFSKGKRLVTTLGIEDMILIDTSDALFLASKTSLDNFGKLYDELEKKNNNYLETDSEVLRPWGKYEVLCQEDNYKVKKIIVKPKGKLSLQKHKYRSEHWTVVRGFAKVIKGEEVINLKQNQSIYIPQGIVHSIQNTGKKLLEIIEVQTGSYFGEDDIERLSDIYGRKDQ